MIQKFKLLLVSIVSIIIPFVAITPTIYAASGDTCHRSFFGVPTWYEYLPLNGDCSVQTKDASGKSTIDGSAVILITLAIVEILLFVAGILAGFFIIYGSFKFILSQGESGKVVAARTTIANAVVGLIIAVVASRVVSFIAARLASSAQSASDSSNVLGNASLPQNLANTASIQYLLGFIFALAGAIALLVITIAGFNFVTSQGEPQKVATARMTILYAIVGLVISVFAFTIVKFVLGKA